VDLRLVVAKHEAMRRRPAASRKIRAAAGSSELRSLSTDIRIPRKVLKGGSHLCAPNYCRRYRPAARHAERSIPRPATSVSDAFPSSSSERKDE
jgi:hypothetical protein